MTPLPTRAPVKSLWATALFAALVFGAAGCGASRKGTLQSLPATTQRGISTIEYRSDLLAITTPPDGWVSEPIKQSDKHTHQLWISPSGRTAYGILYFKLPWPIGQELTLRGFLNEMKKTEGSATLLKKGKDPNLPGLRFVAEGGLYLVRANLIVDGWRGWAIYAATKVKMDVDAKELELATRARESTRVGADVTPDGSPKNPGATQPSR
jgi:hypothetical protein